MQLIIFASVHNSFCSLHTKVRYCL